ncbi:hypothetical protein BCR43DRAFT_487062 [Syncephalastrum racemosum]|uniref:C2H2-type domain-containing protein n=1 Tax=Syncephalastrum racemosum TaxID=13706 RepID=A0A1X2HQ84_SYNRA|nr:hypothetical protein BCR43DRAFT_487062 [Syncephalastrum racemosum]
MGEHQVQSPTTPYDDNNQTSQPVAPSFSSSPRISSPPLSSSYYPNPLCVENRYLSVLSLIDVVYPPQLCTVCDCVVIPRRRYEAKKHTHSSQPRYACLHPHCNMRFRTRGALRYHLSRSHLVAQAPLESIEPSPPFLHYNIEPPWGPFKDTTDNKRSCEQKA